MHFVNRFYTYIGVYLYQQMKKGTPRGVGYKDMKRYEILANNGQVLEHGFTSQKQALARIRDYKKLYPNDTFKIREYGIGKYGNE